MRCQAEQQNTHSRSLADCRPVHDNSTQTAKLLKRRNTCVISFDLSTTINKSVPKHEAKKVITFQHVHGECKLGEHFSFLKQVLKEYSNHKNNYYLLRSKGLQSVLKGFPRSFKTFQKGFQTVSKGFPKRFKRVSKVF